MNITIHSQRRDGKNQVTIADSSNVGSTSFVTEVVTPTPVILDIRDGGGRVLLYSPRMVSHPKWELQTDADGSQYLAKVI